MAVQTITYANKTALNENPDVAAVNKCQAADLNEIKSVVNNNATELSNVFDSGTNANGSWIKYSDGTMICAGKKSSGTITWQSDSNHYLALALTYDDFPQTFISQPTVTKTIESATPTQRYMGIIGGSAPTTTNAGTYNLITYWNASNTSVIASYIAIGKWK